MSTSVLIVDDDASFRRTARELLSARGYAIAGEASDGEGGIAAARRLQPDAILLDIHLPDRDGFDVTRELSHNGDTPRILLTSSDPEQLSAVFAAEAGAAGFVPKIELASVDLDLYFSR